MTRFVIDAETALKKTNRKFRQRFKFIEQNLQKNGLNFDNTTLAEMDALWNESKKK